MATWMKGLKFNKMTGSTAEIPTNLKGMRVVERHVFYKDRADGSQVVFDCAALVVNQGRGKGKVRKCSVVITCGTRAIGFTTDHAGDYQVSCTEARNYNMRSWAERVVHIAAHDGPKLATSKMNRMAKNCLGGIAHFLRGQGFWLSALAKRNLQAEGGLRWYGLTDKWRVPADKLDSYRARAARLVSLKNRNRWVREDVPVAGINGAL